MTAADEEFRNPVNYIIMTITVVSFLVALLCLFWFVLAEYPKDIILSKVDILSLYAEFDPNTRQKLAQKIGDYECSNGIIDASNAANDRIAHNTGLLFAKGPVPYIIASFVVLVIITIIFTVKCNCWGSQVIISGYDWILICLAFCGVLVELVLYFVVIQNWKFIPDNEIYQILSEQVN